MSKRGDVPSLQDILEAINRIQRYVGSASFDGFIADTSKQDAVVRNFQIMGDAVKNISADFRKTHKQVEWKDIAGLRDKVIHHYFSIDWDVLWDVIQNKLSPLKAKIEHVLAGLDKK